MKTPANYFAEPFSFSVENYHRMAETGILSEDDRVELLYGQIILKSPIGKFHNACVNRLTRLMIRLMDDRAIVQIQGPVVIGDRSEPEPDVAILQPRDDFYAAGLPTAADAMLLIEVADSSLEKDKHLKLPLYAAAGIPELWLVDLTRSKVMVFTQPTEDGYAVLNEFDRNQDIHSPFAGAIPAVQVLG